MFQRICIYLALMMVLGSWSRVSAGQAAAERLTFVRPPAPESTLDPQGRLAIDIDHWSTDEARDRLSAAARERADAPLLDALRDVGRVGTLRWPGGLQYAIRYARQTPRADGGRDLVLVVERPLWFWWNAEAPKTSYDFSVVQVSLDRNGVGQGRTSVGAAVKPHATLGVALDGGSTAPFELQDVRRG